MLRWETDKDTVCESVRKRESFLKIILKTRDDPILLDRWINHHVRIVGEESIIIFDNMSIDISVMQIYQSNKNMLICQFNGYQDYIHDSQRYKELYAALKVSCKFYIFLDTDEFMAWAYNDRFYGDEQVLYRLKELPSGVCYPGVWLRNLIGHDNRFYAFSEEYLVDGLLWGKPLIATQTNITCSLVIHNEHLFKTNMISLRSPRNLFVLHLNRLVPIQRIRANIFKLRTYGVYADEKNLEEILAIDTSLIEDQNHRIYTREIQALAQLPLGFKEQLGMSVEFCDDGSLQFSDEKTKLIFSSFLTHSGASQDLD